MGRRGEEEEAIGVTTMEGMMGITRKSTIMMEEVTMKVVGGATIPPRGVTRLRDIHPKGHTRPR